MITKKEVLQMVPRTLGAIRGNIRKNIFEIMSQLDFNFLKIVFGLEVVQHVNHSC
ncbi:hypothetical protein [Paenibacillus sp. FSL L8-0463]|uniref:hypothetical protein n=1 Tax=Paenibacillus sp. FSL L8-0463 TaxID=2954687 RepID=UPI00311A40D1